MEKTLESPLDCKEIQPARPRGDQSRVLIGRTDAEAETPILWPPHVKSWLVVKDPDAGRDWGQGENGTTEDEMAGWHHRLDGREFEQTLGVGDGQGGLACCGSWGRKESDTTEQLNWTELNANFNSLLMTEIICSNCNKPKLIVFMDSEIIPSAILRLQCILLNSKRAPEKIILEIRK